MVQIIDEYRPQSLGERFGRAFSSASQQAAEKIPQHLLQERELKNQNAFATRLGLDLEGIRDPELRQKAIDYALRGKYDEESDARKFQNSTAQDILGNWGPSGGEISGGSNPVQNAFNQMAGILHEGRIGKGSNILGAGFAKTAKDVGKFTSLSAALEAALVDKVSRGALSDARFKYITQTLLPKSNDSKATIRGKLEGLAEILGLDQSVLSGRPPSSSSKGKQSLEEIFG